jgi:hypothetical protein
VSSNQTKPYSADERGRCRSHWDSKYKETLRALEVETGHKNPSSESGKISSPCEPLLPTVLKLYFHIPHQRPNIRHCHGLWMRTTHRPQDISELYCNAETCDGRHLTCSMPESWRHELHGIQRRPPRKLNS